MAEVSGYKGFNAKFRCRGMQYKEGQTFSVSTEKQQLELCKHGLHFCTKFPDVLMYYPPFNQMYGGRTIYAVVKATGEVLQQPGDSKCVTDRLHVDHVIDLDNDLTRSTGLYACVDGKLVDDTGLSFTPIRIAQKSNVVVKCTHTGIALRSQSVVTARIAIALSNNSIARSTGNGRTISIATDVDSIAESNVLAICPCGMAVASQREVNGLFYPGDVGGIAFGLFAEAQSRLAIAIGGTLRGVKGSLLVFLRPGDDSTTQPGMLKGMKTMNPPCAYVFHVDGEKVKENVWYRCSDKGALEEVDYSKNMK